MKKIGYIFSLFFLAVFIFNGCVFLDSKKKQIIFENNTSEIKVENSLVEKNAGDNNGDVSNIVNKTEEKKEEASKATSTEDLENKSENTIKEEKTTLKIIDKLVDWGFERISKRKIDTIIIHSSYNAIGSDPHNLDDIIYKEYKPYGVSPHYIISREGEIYRLVEDENVAYHAGESEVPDGRKGVNNFSIGIEIVNTKSEKPTNAQYTSLIKLIKQLNAKYNIKYVLGHSEISVGRKDDPWNFDFDKVR